MRTTWSMTSPYFKFSGDVTAQVEMPSTRQVTQRDKRVRQSMAQRVASRQGSWQDMNAGLKKGMEAGFKTESKEQGRCKGGNSKEQGRWNRGKSIKYPGPS